MDGDSRLMLATVAKDNYIEVEAKNNDYKTILEAQKVLINDFAQTMPELDETENKIKDIDAEIADVEEQLLNAQQILIQQLNSNQNKEPKGDAGNILPEIITSFQGDLVKLSQEAVNNGQYNVPIFKLIDLEERASNLISSLEESKMYPETEEENTKRIQNSQAHSAKLAQFLRLLKEIYAKASQEQNN
ncbi:hypothetical protein TVAG_302650 [Trichomonas vaginalis G3]|uniref:Uncharacterized protein n=1 Tax=Trichomonas vaginalis (strain ATCC PRA-98 / G3) TaxID=412133 RepID=A2EGU0_TRIV3|nr:hypothetical protein TVAGG3_0172610 [Trichomonas vaginalis G3]EAY08178.1 hypothetical protein TVAG_302650 [Trichomonas vaginalis G3]KAI5548690.1 hypothetical protein TVAGG3_0172610 [Trichomonas vaginalis G3]|eukprot:XP_001320401.1 hypothetical protein [Trichomonas vaginalis G3]